jgi:hypothetical protein
MNNSFYLRNDRQNSLNQSAIYLRLENGIDPPAVTSIKKYIDLKSWENTNCLKNPITSEEKKIKFYLDSIREKICLYEEKMKAHEIKITPTIIRSEI